MMLSDDVIDGVFYALLGRRCEDPATIRQNHHSIEGLVAAIQGWPEYATRRQDSRLQPRTRRLAHIDTEATQDSLEALWQRVAAQWSALGESDPWWSVLSAPQFRSETIDSDGIDDLYLSGSAILGELQGAVESTGANVKHVVDYGCGVGRISKHLVREGFRVCGVDVSPGNLRLANQYLAQTSGHFAPLQLTHLEDLWLIPTFDALVSFITLQHNPPPIQSEIISSWCRRIRPGGILLFQYVADMPGYEFRTAFFLDTPEIEMDMHALPTRHVFRLLQSHGLVVLDHHADGWGGGQTESYTVLARKPSESEPGVLP